MASSLKISRELCTYTACYCEENIWMLCDSIRKSFPARLNDFYVIFISNDTRQIPLWHQNAGKNPPNYQVVWDYHVILIHRTSSLTEDSGCLVYDLDTRLSFPCSFEHYTDATIGSDRNLKPQYHRAVLHLISKYGNRALKGIRKFRLISAQIYLESFTSDRSHMLTEEGEYMAPPPTYPCISSPGCTNNIELYISMTDTDDKRYGRVLDLNSFINFFNKKT